MENCLVTKLKGTINNDSLKKLNVLTLEIVNAEQEVGLVILNSNDMTVKIVGEGTFFTNFDSTPRTIGNIGTGATITFSSGSYKVEISGLYTITGIRTASSCIKFNLEDLRYSTLDNLNGLVLTNTQVYGDLSALAGKPLPIIRIEETGLTGNGVALGNLNLNILRDLQIFHTSISGTIEDMVATAVTNGYTVSSSSPLFVHGLLTKLSFGGNFNYTTSARNAFITWDSVNKITVYFGSATFSNCNTIWAKGATSEEIAAWENAGKTVVVVS